MPKVNISPTVAAIIGTTIMVLTDIVHYAGGVIPSQYLAYINAAIAILTWASVNVLHTTAVAKAKAAAHDDGYKAGVAVMKRK